MKKFKPFLFVLLGFAASRCNLLQGIYPFGTALLCVLNGTENFIFTLFGTFIGSLTLSLTFGDMLINSLPYALILPMILLLDKYGAKRMMYMLAAAVSFAIPALVINIEFSEKVTMLFSGLFAFCLVPLLSRLYISLTQIKSRLSLERADIISLCCVGGLAISSLPRTDIFGFDICVTALLFTSSLAVCAFEMKGSIWASVCGIMWVVKGGDTTTALCLISGGIFGGMLSKKRGGILLGFILGDLMISLFTLHMPSLSVGTVNMICGCVYTVFMKKEFIEKLKRLAGISSGVNDLEMNYVESLRERQKNKLESAGRMYAELSRTMRHASRGNDFRGELVARTVSVCENCKKRDYCLKSRRSDTLIELGEAADAIIENEQLSALPITLTARCIQPMNVLCAMRDSFASMASFQAENPTAEDELALQLKSVSEMLFSLASDISELPEFDKELEKQAYDVLSSRVGNVRRVVCRKSGESHVLTVSVKENTKVTRKKICDALSDGFLGKYRCIDGGTDKSGGFTGVFAPLPRYSVEAYACRSNKRGESVCGDAFTFCNVENDRYLAAISDGAGSGQRAAVKSEGALDMLEAFSDAELPRTEIFNTMNRLLLLKGDSEAYSTMDVTEFDLEAGILYWTKIGAVPGYIMREGKVEKIESGALPIGIITSIKPGITKKLVRDGDIIVMVSDGVYDGLCAGASDGIVKLLISEKGGDIRQLAERILSEAQSTANDDDMTVMVLKMQKAS